MNKKITVDRISYLILLFFYVGSIFDNRLFDYSIFLFILFLLTRSKIDFSSYKLFSPVIISFLISTVILLSTSFSFVSIINGIKVFLLPASLFYIGQYFGRIDDDDKIYPLLKNIFILSFPLGIIGEIYVVGEFKFFNRPGGDSFGGIFGPQGGSGQLGMLSTILLTYMYAQKYYFKNHKMKILLYGILFLIMVLLSEAKIALFLIVLLLAVLLVAKFKKKINFKAIIGVAVLIILYQSFYTYFFPTWESKIFSQQYLVNYLALGDIEEGVFLQRTKGDGNSTEGEIRELTRLTRVGALYFSVAEISSDATTFLFGHGPGTGQKSFLYSSLIATMGFEFYRVDFYSGPNILFEFGIIGLLAWGFILVRIFFTLLRDFKENVTDGRNILLFVLLFTPAVMLTLFYNNSLFVVNFGGIYWLYLGTYFKIKTL